MKREKVEAVIKTGSGVELKIESDRATVREIVIELHRREEQRARFREDFVRRRERSSKQNNKNIQEHKDISKKNSSKKTKKEIVLDLIKSRFFDEPKLIGDIQRAMAEKGYHYPSTSLSPLLLRLVRQSTLARTREEEAWRYTKQE